MNLPILYQNCTSMFASEYAKSYWLWLADNHDETAAKYKCDKLALEVDEICSFLENGILDKAFDLLQKQGLEFDRDATSQDLIRFILKRHANWRLGQNVKMWWE